MQGASFRRLRRDAVEAASAHLTATGEAVEEKASGAARRPHAPLNPCTARTALGTSATSSTTAPSRSKSSVEARDSSIGVRDTGRAPIVVEVAVSLDRDAVHLDPESLGLAVSVVQQAEGLGKMEQVAAVGCRTRDDTFIGPGVVEHGAFRGAKVPAVARTQSGDGSMYRFCSHDGTMESDPSYGDDASFAACRRLTYLVQ